MEKEALNCPYGSVGDILWVRETTAQKLIEYGTHEEWKTIYKADNPNEMDRENWKPSIFMPKKACRIFLQITDIKVERLKDISFQDAISEGVENKIIKSEVFKTYEGFKNYYPQDIEDEGYYKSPIDSYKSLWKSINGWNNWEENPFVWAITFKRAERPKGASS